MIVAVCLTLSAVHGMIWFRRRDEVASAMFALLSFTSAIMAVFDLAMMRAHSPEMYAQLLRWFHVAIFFAIATSIGFLHFYLGGGRLWLGALAVIIRLISLVINFLAPVNLNFREITSMAVIPFFGDRVTIPVGVSNPAMSIGQLSLVFLLLYAVDAAMTCWRRGRRRRALAAGGAMVLFVGLASTQGALVYWGVIEAPVIASLFFIGIVAVMAYELSRDVLSAVRLNRDLVRERAITDAIFDGLPGMIYVYSPESRLIRWNKRVEADSGYSKKELAGMKPEQWLDPEDVHTLTREWQHAMDKQTGRFEAHLTFKGGRKVPYLLTGIRVDIDGKPHLVGMGLDISRQKKMESELQDQQRELSRLNRVASVGVLAASIAHELNQPLAAVKSNAEAGKRYLAVEQPDLREVRETMEDILAANERASDVVRGLRALMRKEPPREEPVHLNDVVTSVVLIVQAECTSRGIQIDKLLDDALPPVRGDRVQLQQVMLNLLLNAIDALSERVTSPRQIQLRTERGESGRVRLSVRDNGPGIRPENMEEVFTTFFTSKNKGMGMGLPISRSIVEWHGGKIRACSTGEAGGALFEVEIPVQET